MPTATASTTTARRQATTINDDDDYTLKGFVMYTHFSMKDAAPNFGSCACELCHTSIAGERYDYIARDVDDEIVELSMCVDCVFDVEGTSCTN